MTPRGTFEDRLRAAVEEVVRGECRALGRPGTVAIEVWTDHHLSTPFRERIDDIAVRAARAQRCTADRVAFRETTEDIAFRVVGTTLTREERRPRRADPDVGPAPVLPTDPDATRVLPRASTSGQPRAVGGYTLRLVWLDLVSQHSVLPDRRWRRIGRPGSRHGRIADPADARPFRVPAALTCVPSGWLLELCGTEEMVLLRRTGERPECAVELDAAELLHGRPCRLGTWGELRFTTRSGATRLEYELIPSGTVS
jgi:hypothetical protein